MFDALYQPQTDRVIRDQVLRPTVPPSAEPGLFSGTGSSLWRAAGAATAETLRGLHRAITASSDDVLARQQAEADDALAGEILKHRVDLELRQESRDAELRRFREGMTPDPATTGEAARLTFDIARPVLKAVGYTMAAGPFGGAALFGLDEGATGYMEMRDRGVGPDVAAEVGAVRGLTMGVGAAIPAVGSTLAKTVLLGAGVNPALFVAEQAATKAVLERADYDELAKQYNPLDPIGLALSAGFGLFLSGGMYGAGRARARLFAPDGPEVAAAQVTRLAVERQKAALHAPGDAEGANAHADALATAHAALENGEAVHVESVKVDPAIADTARNEIRAKLDADPTVLASTIERARTLSPEDRAIETRLAEEFAADPDAAAARYAELKDAEGGKVLNTDTARELAPEYLADRTKSAAVHEPASWLIKRLYATKLAQAPADNERPLVFFTAGGTGAGKTSAIRNIPQLQALKGASQIVFDTNMNGYGSAKTKIDQALAAGKSVQVAYVYRDPVDALVGGALPRAEKQRAQHGSGRTVPVEEHLATHVGVADVLPRLMADYADDARVEFVGVDNTLGEKKARFSNIATLLERAQNRRVDLDELRAALKAEHDQGRISDETYRGFAGGLPEPRAAEVDAAQGVRGTDGAVDGRGDQQPAARGNRPGPAGAEEVIAAAPRGETARVATERGTTLEVEYAVVEAGDLITSHTNDLKAEPRFPPELQPRDRARAASEGQITKIENALNPELLGASAKASDGAPIIGADGVVESGNARTIALRRAYAGNKAEGYRAWLRDNAAKFGLDEAAVGGMREPVLVRITRGQYDRAEFARQANEANIAALSATEQAKVDAQRLPDLSRLVANEDGTINLSQSAQFIRDFLETTASPADRGRLMTEGGLISQEGLARIRNALFARAYGDSEIVAMMAESTDANVRNVLAGMMRAAPRMAQMRDLIDAGARMALDPSDDLTAAVKMFSRLRSAGQSVDNFLAQGELLGSPLTPEATTLLRAVNQSARSPKGIAGMIEQMVDTVDAIGDPRQIGLLDAPTATRGDVVKAGANNDQAVLRAAQEALRVDPGLKIAAGVDAEGNVVLASATDLLKQADVDIVQAQRMGRGVEAAVSCFLATGG